MSADNYYFIRKIGDRYAVTMEFESAGEPGPIDGSARYFPRLGEAINYAAGEYSEYGVRVSPEIEREAFQVAGAARGTTRKPVKAVAKKAAASVSSIDSPLFAYPATDVDRLICAASLAAVEQSDGVSSMDHLNIMLLATHPEWCKEFLEPRDAKLLEKAVAEAPADLLVGKGDSIRWKECRDYLELRKAIRVDRSATEQFIATTAETSTVKATLPGGVDAVVALAATAAKTLAEESR